MGEGNKPSQREAAELWGSFVTAAKPSLFSFIKGREEGKQERRERGEGEKNEKKEINSS